MMLCKNSQCSKLCANHIVYYTPFSPRQSIISIYYVIQLHLLKSESIKAKKIKISVQYHIDL